MSEKRILMARLIPKGSCPCCGHLQFVVVEAQINYYLTNMDAEIIDSKEKYYHAKGKCCNCGSEYDMIPTREGFIPATPLRKHLFKYSTHYDEIYLDENKYIKNPMMEDK